MLEAHEQQLACAAQAVQALLQQQQAQARLSAPNRAPWRAYTPLNERMSAPKRPKPSASARLNAPKRAHDRA